MCLSALPQDCAYLCNMAVDPACRRLGVGLALVQCIEEVASAAGVRAQHAMHANLAVCCGGWGCGRSAACAQRDPAVGYLPDSICGA